MEVRILRRLVKIASLHFQVKFFSTGEVAMIGIDCWLPFSNLLGEDLKEDKATNRGSFGEAY